MKENQELYREKKKNSGRLKEKKNSEGVGKDVLELKKMDTLGVQIQTPTRRHV